LRRLIEENHSRRAYVTAINERAYFGATRRRAVAIDLKRLPDLEGFPRQIELDL
jgi:hypothetical protein